MRTFAAFLTSFMLMFSSPVWAIDFNFGGDKPVETGPKTSTDKIVDRFMELDLDAEDSELNPLNVEGSESVPLNVEASEPVPLNAEGSTPTPKTPGVVSFEEYMMMVQARAEARYASMDANEDGGVTADEYRAFWKAQKSQYYRLKR